MNPQMNLLFLKNTGQVLTAFTRSGEPDTAETAPDAFVLDGLHCHALGDASTYPTPADFNAQEFVIPTSEIGITRMDLQDAVLRSPQSSYLTGLDSTPPAPALNSFSGGPLTINSAANAFPVTIKVPAAIATDVPVSIIVTGGALAQALTLPSTKIPAPAGTLALPIPSQSAGQYYALVFAVGYPILVCPFKV